MEGDGQGWSPSCARHQEELTGLLLQQIGLSVRDSQIQMVLLDAGVLRQNTTPRVPCLNGRRQVVDWRGSP